nr:uncharacterized protein LOC106041313 isoform X1 [Anser cygnoides]
MTTLQRLLLSCAVRAFYSLPSPRGLACRRGFGGGVNSRPAFQSSELCHCVVRQVGSGDAVIIAGHAGRLFKAPGGQVRAAFQTLPRQLKGVKDESRREASVWGLNVIILALGSCLPCSRRVSVLAAGQLPCDSLPCTAASLTGGRGRLPIGRGRALGPKAPRHWRRRRWQVKSPRGLAEGWVSNLNVGCARRERCCRPPAAVTNNEDGQLCLEVLRTQPALSLVLLAEEVTRLCSGVLTSLDRSTEQVDQYGRSIERRLVQPTTTADVPGSVLALSSPALKLRSAAPNHQSDAHTDRQTTAQHYLGEPWFSQNPAGSQLQSSPQPHTSTAQRGPLRRGRAEVHLLGLIANHVSAITDAAGSWPALNNLGKNCIY